VSHQRLGIIVLTLSALALGACGRSTVADAPTLRGHRVQTARVVAAGVPTYQVGAYEIVFPDSRAALLVDLTGGQGIAHGFVEWSGGRETPDTYVAGGWARQRDVAGERVTVFELSLNHLVVKGRATPASAYQPPLAVRLVVNEASGDATLTERR
jgi:hypothetical protein